MSAIHTPLQPDQQPALWDGYVEPYEQVFEPLTDAFARAALDGLGDLDGQRLLDVGAGSGGGALLAARRGAEVLAIDASPAMVRRIEARATADGAGRIQAAVMDGASLDCADASFDAAISVFGLILFPDPIAALREVRRVLRPGARVGLVTWTRPDRYELVTRLLAAIATVRGPQPPPPGVPAQLRFRQEDDLRSLLAAGGFSVESVQVREERLGAPSAAWLAERIGFAPGLAALLSAQGEDRAAVLSRFAADLRRDFGDGPVALDAVAFVAIGS